MLNDKLKPLSMCNAKKIADALNELKNNIYDFTINLKNEIIMDENLNLVKILKNVPKGTKLYTTIYGEVELVDVSSESINYPIMIRTNGGNLVELTKYGQFVSIGECILFPSKEQRDWNKFKVDYPIDTKVMASNNKLSWQLRYYSSKKNCFYDGYSSKDNKSTVPWEYIVPVSDFDFNNPESNISKSI